MGTSRERESVCAMPNLKQSGGKAKTNTLKLRSTLAGSQSSHFHERVESESETLLGDEVP